jgi:hypothetical protein
MIFLHNTKNKIKKKSEKIEEMLKPSPRHRWIAPYNQFQIVRISTNGSQLARENLQTAFPYSNSAREKVSSRTMHPVSILYMYTYIYIYIYWDSQSLRAWSSRKKKLL